MLNFFVALRWDMLADVVQVLMCGVILACLIHNKVGHKRLLVSPLHHKAAPVFYQEVMLQSLRQQAEQALSSIRTAVESEQAKLQQLIEANQSPSEAATGSESEVSAEQMPFRLGGDLPFHPEGAGNRYDGLIELDGQGLTVRQIAAQTRLPAGEVELALTVQRRCHENGRQQ